MKTTINFILDKSGSMMSVWDATINGFNEYLQELRKDKESEYDIRLTLFDTSVDVKEKQPIKEFKDLTKETYLPNGSTALYDAACKTMHEIKGKGKQLVVIMTDGQENSSREYSAASFKALKEELEKKGNFTFIFLGANQDAWANAQHWGFDAQNVSTFNSTNHGTNVMFANVAASTKTFARSAAMSSADMFTKEQQYQMKASK